MSIAKRIHLLELSECSNYKLVVENRIIEMIPRNQCTVTESKHWNWIYSRMKLAISTTVFDFIKLLGSNGINECDSESLIQLEEFWQLTLSSEKCQDIWQMFFFSKNILFLKNYFFFFGNNAFKTIHGRVNESNSYTHPRIPFLNEHEHDLELIVTATN